MIIPSRGTSEFWRRYRALPAEVRTLAQKNYRLWSANAFHPSLHFKSIDKSDWSVRAGGHYRAVGKFSGETFLWEWIGSHEEYNKRF
ncbi:MAG TPA: hypothetical protein VIK35_05900 [Verrucomicrobiae bacterium]